MPMLRRLYLIGRRFALLFTYIDIFNVVFLLVFWGFCFSCFEALCAINSNYVKCNIFINTFAKTAPRVRGVINLAGQLGRLVSSVWGFERGRERRQSLCLGSVKTRKRGN